MSLTVIRLLFFALIFAQEKPALAKLPEGRGKAALIKACNSCHGAEVVVGTNNTRKGWAELVDEMIFKGASATPAQRLDIVNYLAKNFPMRRQ